MRVQPVARFGQPVVALAGVVWWHLHSPPHASQLPRSRRALRASIAYSRISSEKTADSRDIGDSHTDSREARRRANRLSALSRAGALRIASRINAGRLLGDVGQGLARNGSLEPDHEIERGEVGAGGTKELTQQAPQPVAVDGARQRLAADDEAHSTRATACRRSDDLHMAPFTPRTVAEDGFESAGAGKTRRLVRGAPVRRFALARAGRRDRSPLELDGETGAALRTAATAFAASDVFHSALKPGRARRIFEGGEREFQMAG